MQTNIPFFSDLPFLMRDDKQMESPLSLSAVGLAFCSYQAVYKKNSHRVCVWHLQHLQGAVLGAHPGLWWNRISSASLLHLLSDIRLSSQHLQAWTVLFLLLTGLTAPPSINRRHKGDYKHKKVVLHIVLQSFHIVPKFLGIAKIHILAYPFNIIITVK